MKYFLFFLTVVLYSGNTFSQGVNFTLTPKSDPIQNAIFEIIEVENLGRNLSEIGKVYTDANKMQSARMGNNLSEVFKSYMNQSIRSKNSVNQAILVKVEQFEIAESKASGNVASGELKIKLGFYVKSSFEPIHLLDYEGGMNYRRSINRLDLAQKVIQQAMDNALEYFDQWINSQALSNRALAGSVQIVVEDGDYISGRDTVFYRPERPLTWKDFTDRPRTGSTYNAVIFTSLAMEGKPFVKDGSIILPLTVKVYMLPGQSWVKNKNDYSLNHEQRHFDVVRVVADRLKKNLQNLDVNPENYEAMVNDAYFEAYREMNRLQELYDGQTNHGIKKDIQEKWNKMLDEALEGDYRRLERVLD